jgi:hypothetical protein
MTQIYGAAGIEEYDEVTGSSSVSSFAVDIDPNVAITLVTGEWAASSESSNYNTRISIRDSGNSIQSVQFRTWTNGTTSAFGSGNTTQSTIMYWNLGALNNTSYTGEHMRTMMWIYNDSQSSIPFQHATIYGRTSWEGNTGITHDAMYTIKCRTTAKISSILFVPQAQSFRWHRANSWSMADT